MWECEVMGCGRKIGRFDCCTVVQGDCVSLLAELPPLSIDAIVTDPPYGIGADKKKAHSSIRDSADWADVSWDIAPPHAAVENLLTTAKSVIIWGGNYFHLPPSQCWLVWNKPQRNFSLADAELAWTNFSSSVRVFGYQRSDGNREHPTQKPLALMQWCVSKVKGQTILDPFAGSGTTLVAAKKLGRHFLGFEISPEYCAIARKRLAEIDAQPSLFEPKPEQMTLTC